MSRDSFSYTHGDTGTAPSSSLNFEKNERPQAGHFDWYWYNVTEAISGHADEFDRLDSDDDGVVDESDTLAAGGNLKGDLTAANGEIIWDESATYIPQSRLQNDTVTVAGNGVSLGGSTSVAHGDLSDSPASAHHSRYADEEAQDAVGTILGTDINYDDANNTISLAATLGVDISGDADTVDGNHASAFASSGHLHDNRYVDESGDTMSGALTIGGDLTATNGETIWDESASYIPQNQLQNDSVTVAGNTVGLGGSTGVALGDLSNVSASGEGSGNGLNADQLDGNHASAFADSGHLHDGRYYTESESDSNFAASGHSHSLGDLSNVTASGEGSGNNFDADTVDGSHASDLGRSTAEIQEQALAYDFI